MMAKRLVAKLTCAALGALTLALSGCGGNTAGEVKLTGAGATFPAPLYQQWFKDYTRANKGVKINYQAVGSGSGVKQFTEGTVQFGASDVGMKKTEIDKIEQGVILLPMTAGSIVLAYNLDGYEDELKLSQEAYIKIFKGEITQWNDPLIKKDNPKIPDKKISIVTRADSSGTTAVFTQHLKAIGKEKWDDKMVGKKVTWPGSFTGAEGNSSVTSQIQNNVGSLGYIEYGYAVNNNLKMASLENKAGAFVQPTTASGQATLAQIKLNDNLMAFDLNPEGKDSYPIVTFTWIMAYKKYDDAKQAETLKKMLKFCLEDSAQQNAEKLGYLPLPTAVRSRVSEAIDKINK